ncbi:MAG: hypothetical protein AB7T22_00985 [Calditrichaceae bacterium]
MPHKNVYRIAPFGVHWAIENDEFGLSLYFSKGNALSAANQMIKEEPDAIIKIYDHNGKFEKSIKFDHSNKSI